MNKFTKRDYLNVTLLGILYLAIVLIITRGEYMYGSVTDWDVQHWAIPEYFRNLFYETKELLPNFAPNLGGGQNIFYFAYYGFLSPLILLSYLLPNIQMYDYISISSVIMGIISVVLLYKWLKNNNFKTNICLAVSFLFLCAGPLIFQSHRHVMFINYMPFLIMGLMAVDHYFKTGKRPLLILSVFLIIMTSYFYSVGGIVAIAIYGIYVYLRKNEHPTLKSFLKEAVKFAIPIIVAILMACILLLPVLNALTSGRIHGDVPLNIKELIFPHFGLEYLLYSSYSVGLTAIVIIALFSNLVFKKPANLFLNITLIALITANFFVYILNGTLYLDGKALIPLLPVYCFAIAKFFRRVFENKIELYNILAMFAITLMIVILFSDRVSAVLYIIDGTLMILLLYSYYNHHNENKLLIPIMVIAYIICVCVNCGDQLIPKEIHQKQNSEEITKLVKKATSEDKSYYRIYTDVKGGSQNVNRVLDNNENLITLYSSTYNREYNKFFYHTFNNNLPYRNSVITHENKNVMFETFMGVKYLITDKTPPMGYKKVNRAKDYVLYKNENTMPVGYASANVLSEKQYKALKYPYKLEALMNNIVVKDAKDKALTSKMKRIRSDYKEAKTSNLDIKQKGHKYIVKTKTNQPGHAKFKLQGNLKNKLLLIRIHVSNPQSCLKGDTAITINGVKNKLTCREWKYYNHNQTFDYTLSSKKDTKDLDIVFSEGKYTINAIQVFALDYKEVSSLKDNVDTFNIDTKNTQGDNINGTVDVKNKGYFMMTIPYDEGFKAKVDKKPVKCEKVNGAFIGFPIDKGHHKIEITYESPNFALGKKCSFIGFGLFIVIIGYDLITKRKKKAN